MAYLHVLPPSFVGYPSWEIALIRGATDGDPAGDSGPRRLASALGAGGIFEPNFLGTIVGIVVKPVRTTPPRHTKAQLTE